jgi:hypothetical protein
MLAVCSAKDEGDNRAQFTMKMEKNKRHMKGWLDDLGRKIGIRVPSRTDDDGSFRLESTITKESIAEQYAQQVLYYRMYKYV